MEMFMDREKGKPIRLSAKDIIDNLKRLPEPIKCNRKTIYSDIQALFDSGFISQSIPIEKSKDKMITTALSYAHDNVYFKEIEYHHNPKLTASDMELLLRAIKLDKTATTGEKRTTFQKLLTLCHPDDRVKMMEKWKHFEDNR